ncbi:hypothetical protein Psyaliredsea_24340 [Psychrobacter alimentarius]
MDNLVFVSNTAGRFPNTKVISEYLVEQTLQVFANTKHALNAVKSSLADVVMFCLFIQNPKDTMTVLEIFSKKFKGVDLVTNVSCPPLNFIIYKV